MPDELAAGLDGDHGVGVHAALERGRGVQREDLAVIHDGDPVAELVGLFHVVRGEHDRLAVAVQLAEQVPQRQAALRVQARGRLVEE